jgi:hypothetical protein
VRCQHCRTGFDQFRIIIRVDGEQRITLLYKVTNFAVDDEPDGVINRIRLFGPPCTQLHSRLTYASRMDL